MHFYLKLANNYHIGIFDGALTETMLVTTENPGPLPLRSQIRQSHAESMPGRIWDHGTLLLVYVVARVGQLAESKDVFVSSMARPTGRHKIAFGFARTESGLSSSSKDIPSTSIVFIVVFMFTGVVVLVIDL